MADDRYFKMQLGDCTVHFFKDGEKSFDPKVMFPGYSQMKWAKLFLSFFDNIDIVKEIRDEQVIRLSFQYCLV